MNGEGSGENTLEFGEKEKHTEEGEEECGVENDRGNKRIKEMSIDQFNKLPDSLLIHILSFLNVKKAAITCVLSKRWEFLWAELPNLEFGAEFLGTPSDNEGEIAKVLNMVSRVNRTLDVRTVNYLEKFGITFIYHKRFASTVDAWVQFSVENKVKILNLYMHYNWDDVYTLPQVIYCCPSLTTLHVTGCIMASKVKIEWQSLTHLNLHEVSLDQLLVDEILSSCPVLYEIQLEKCFGFDRLETNSPSLRTVSIEDNEDEDGPLLKISVPYVHKLDISLLMKGRKLQLGNILCLGRASIDCVLLLWGWDPSSVEVMSSAKEILESVQHAKELHVGLQFIEVVSMMAVNGWQLPQSRRELLTVSIATEYKHSISGIIALLESSPNLEELLIEGYSIGEDVILDPATRDDLAGDLLHLKTIKIRNFVESKGEPLLTLVRILLKRATTLEEMLIKTNVELSEFVEMAQTILTYPRSSTEAEVHFFN